MRELLNNLLISEVSVVSGASQETIKNWIRYGQITHPPLYGKHRRFSDRNTVECILMATLTQRGIKTSVAGPMAVKAAPSVLYQYTDDWAERRGDKIIMTLPWVLLIDLKNGVSTCGRAEAFTFTSGDWLKIDLAPVIGGALTRALAVAEARNV